MWKTAHGNLPPEPLGCHLCPDCDSIGPHVIMLDELPGDDWLECIDCSAVLGCLTPQGIEPCVELEPMEPTASEMPQRVDCQVVLGALAHSVPAGGAHLDSPPSVNLIAALMGWGRKA